MDAMRQNTEYQNPETVFSSFLRLGFVTETDPENRLVKVRFPDLGFVSDWLPVLINSTFAPDYSGNQQTQPASGGSGDASFASHVHDLNLLPYMPAQGHQVLCIYEPIRGGRGFVLGGIRSWL